MPKPALDAINSLLSEQGDKVKTLAAVSGGCICQAFIVDTQKGKRRFAKTLLDGPDNLFIAEAFSLNTLAPTHTVATPTVIAANASGLLLEYLEPTPPANNYWERLGEQLAMLHQQPQASFGFEQNNYCGETPQPNPLDSDGFHFFVEHRLTFQMHLANEKNLLSVSDNQQLEQLCAQLGNWLPNESPSLLHGDLWTGNIHSGSDGQPYVIDPASYYGWRETDIAMTQLFDGFDSRFYESYHYHLPLQPDWKQRMDLYNLYPLLNHLNLFGSSYLPQIRQILNRFI
jgi:fructosamine-3-kinase